MPDQIPPELDAMIEQHKTGETFNGSPIVNACGDDIVIYGIHDGKVNYETRPLIGENRRGRMAYHKLLNYFGKTIVGETEVCQV